MVEHDDVVFKSKLNRERENILKVMAKGKKHSPVIDTLCFYLAFSQTEAQQSVTSHNIDCYKFGHST